MAPSGASIGLGLVIFAELVVVSWCALWPLRGLLLPLLLHGGEWRGLYSFALGNLDVWLLALLKDVTLVVLVLTTPAAARHAVAAAAAAGRRRGGALPELSSNHKQVRRAVSALCGLHCAVLLVKAAGVAVSAPEELWPQRQNRQPPPAGGADGGGGYGGGYNAGEPSGGAADPQAQVAVGLVYMYVSIGE
ncbi:hypothetical protein GPECTOR_145g749 [Gonium pectorale]|uniref:Uncharacterized protein n=1 Tax=Gonium pectorale TaxID=33097 RepID=A0A150FXZ1_GONPE|nr:hypothetical protein GPECTOR_145g749 [Gonium pectorale]|eukprot:KXZ42458.1 hypothetical protein GPECTOR_145g749 [Gonium pectorale]